jgi:type III restriction enzyme
VLKEVIASDIGVNYASEKVADNYFVNELYYDSELEKENIKTEITEVVVFTKIPKNSIKIPVAGGRTYSPDFAYVIDLGDGGKTLHFVVETKDVKGDKDLRPEELHKIKHAEEFFKGKVKIEFRKQFSSNKIVDLIKDITKD